MKTLAKCATVIALATMLFGCAAQSADSGDEELVQSAHAALSSKSAPKGAYTLSARATYDPVLKTTMVDLATQPIPELGEVPSGNLHTDDQFLAVMVYADRDGRRDVIQIIPRSAIGPGGGCIHFSVPAAVGDRLYIGGVVQLAGTKGARIGVAPTVTVQTGDWQNDPLVRDQHKS